MSAKDLALQLREIVEERDSLPASGSSVASGPAAAPATRTRPLVLVAAGSGILAVVAALGPADPVAGSPAWSPDGLTIATLSAAPPPGLGSVTSPEGSPWNMAALGPEQILYEVPGEGKLRIFG